LTDELRPDLVVVDVKAQAPASRAGRAGLFQHVETQHSVSLVTLGGFGFLLKDRVLQVDEFLAAAERVATGGSALDPNVVAGLVAARGGNDPVSTLTDRELTVLDLMAQGLTNTGIAKRLQLSERTVEAHIRHLLLKLDIPDTDDGHRRVLAVLVHLGTRANRTADT
jgi:DNA-binding NarL/FixJ family response regulator